MTAQKFQNPTTTAKGEERAWVDLTSLNTLWFNTGTLCNLACQNCYIESSPTNDRLVYISAQEVQTYLDEIQELNLPTTEIGLTGGEPFMNPDILTIIESCLEQGFQTLVLTNAMKPMMRPNIKAKLLKLNHHFGTQLKLRVSIDHYTKELHEEERGKNSWSPMIEGLSWLGKHQFNIDIAGRTLWSDNQDKLRQGYQALFNQLDIEIDASNPIALMLFPEMDEQAEVPEITTECWNILGKSPDDMMCATSRMIVKHKGDNSPSVIACTLLPYDSQFNLGKTLKDSDQSVKLNHPHCAKFCVLGGASCSK